MLTRHITLIHFFLVIMTNLEEKFLTRVGISKVECDAMIKSLIILNDIFSIHYQEMQSYTMRDDVVVIQFRKESIDLNTHEKAMKIHRFYILSITCKQSKPFHVYITSYDNRSCYAKEFHVNLMTQKNAFKDLAIILSEYFIKEMNINLDMIKKKIAKLFISIEYSRKSSEFAE